MIYKEIAPHEKLKPYIKSYYLFESESEKEFEDIVFPSGLMEMIFNLGDGIWETSTGNTFQVTPKIELWGQLIKPLAVRSKGKHTMLGVKFYTHTAAYFLKEGIHEFNNRVTDLTDVMDHSVKELHQQLLEAADLKIRINLIENFFSGKLPIKNISTSDKIQKVGRLLSTMKENHSDENVSELASKYGITPRYFHKLISQYTGLSPKLYYKINRFQQSLKLIAGKDTSLTSIACDCGYFDQSHFIKDFKSFTGLTPSVYQESKWTVNELLFA
jgi:AraC-like DNA-binding protein